MKITKRHFGYLAWGERIFIYRIQLTNGAYVEVSDYGATLVSVVVPDNAGRMADVVLGYDSATGYESDFCYMGATVGRFANRIGGAQFSIGDRVYTLEKNDGENTNHGGYAGLHRRVWNAEVLETGIRFSLSDADGEGGYPGNVEVAVTYTFAEDQCLTIRFEGTTDRPTYLNLTNHAYFNLAGSGDVLSHRLYLPSEHILDTDEFYIPTGKFVPVSDTVFDFNSPALLGSRIHENNQQLIWNRGYNHCYPVGHTSGERLAFAAELTDELSGRSLEVRTSLPGVLLYTGNYLTSQPGKQGREYVPYDGVCLETQYFPDTPHHAHFPSCLLNAGERYDESTEYRFKTI